MMNCMFQSSGVAEAAREAVAPEKAFPTNTELLALQQ